MTDISIPLPMEINEPIYGMGKALLLGQVGTALPFSATNSVKTVSNLRKQSKLKKLEKVAEEEKIKGIATGISSAKKGLALGVGAGALHNATTKKDKEKSGSFKYMCNVANFSLQYDALGVAEGGIGAWWLTSAVNKLKETNQQSKQLNNQINAVNDKIGLLKNKAKYAPLAAVPALGAGYLTTRTFDDEQSM